MKSIQYTETKYMLTVSETARMLGVSIHTVYKLIEACALKGNTYKRKSYGDSENRQEHILQAFANGTAEWIQGGEQIQGSCGIY